MTFYIDDSPHICKSGNELEIKRACLTRSSGPRLPAVNAA